MIFDWIIKKRVDSALRELDTLKEDFKAVLYERDNSRSELRRVKDELEDLKLKKKIEEEDIKHLTKIRLEQSEIEYQKKVLAIEQKKDQEVSAIKSEYDEKLRVRLETEVTRLKDMYGEILNRLPNVNVRLKGEV